MATQYTSILKLALPVTGELSGTWGDVVNNNITSMVEQAIAGLSTINTWTANAHTLTVADGTTSESRCAMLVAATGTGGTALTAAGEIICPAASKLYVLKNGAAYAVTLKTAAGTGVAVPAGDTAFLFCDGTNVNACVTTIVNGHISGNLTVDGNTTLGDANTDTVTVTAQFASDLLPSTDNARDLGSTAKSWRTLYCDTSVLVGNLSLAGNTLSSTDTNGNIVIAPNGTGDVQLDADTVRVGDSNANATITTNGTGDLILNTNAGTNSGSITIEDGVNGNIIIAPNGTGQVQITNAALDLTTIEVSNINAKDGTAAITIADSTGAVGISTAVTMSATTQNIALGTSQTTGTFTVGGASQTGTQTFDQSTKTHTLNLGTGATESGLTKTINLGTAGVSGSTTAITVGSANGTTTTLNGTVTAATLNSTTIDTTNIEVTNIKAKDGTAAIVLTDSTGAVTVSTALTANGGAVFNENGADVDFRVEGDTDANLLFVDASADAVGIGTNTPSRKLDVAGTTYNSNEIGGLRLNNTSAVANNFFDVLFGLDGLGRPYGSLRTGNESNAYITFFTGSGPTERMRLTSTGTLNIVGAGTAGSTQAISFNGSAPVDSLVVSAAGNVGIGTSSIFGVLNLQTSTNARFEFTSASTVGSLELLNNARNAYLDYDVYASTHRWRKLGSVAMTLDSSGNLGLGVTPSAWSGIGTTLQVNTGGSFSADAANAYFAANSYYNGTNWIYQTTNNATRYTMAANSHLWYTAPSGTAGNAITFTQAMTLDASGRLLVGYTTTQSFNAALQIKRADATVGATTYTLAWFANATGYENGLAVKATDNAVTLAADFNGAAGGAAALVFATNSTGTANNATERARITSGGLFQVSSGGSVQVGGTAARATTAGTNRVDIFDGTAPVGTLANGVSFYSAAGEANVMDAAGNATLLSPHDSETNEWIFRSKHTPSGKVLRIDVERLLRFVNDHFGLDAVKEFVEE